MLAFQVSLLAAMVTGFVALMVAIFAALLGGGVAFLAAVLFVFGLLAVLAWSLSRPEAKAWFTAVH